MTHDTTDDFDNPQIPEGPKQRCVLYRMNRAEALSLKLKRLRSASSVAPYVDVAFNFGAVRSVDFDKS
jgi:hypothetical protein